VGQYKSVASFSQCRSRCEKQLHDWSSMTLLGCIRFTTRNPETESP
jgi:hypothetical protein